MTTRASPLRYVGGKSRLAQRIIALIPEHKIFCEAFFGAGWVFFTKEPSKYEVINDLDGDLVNFYRVLQNHIEEFLKQFKWLLTSRELFHDFKAQQEAGGLTDIQRAARYYYIQRTCYGGGVRSRTFGVHPRGAYPSFNILRLEEELSAAHLRLACVTIESLSWQEFLKRYDRAGTFFYLDPPYHKIRQYKHNMTLADYRELAAILATLKGEFLLSINDVEEMRELFKDFQCSATQVTYSIDRKNNNYKGKELLICNY